MNTRIDDDGSLIAAPLSQRWRVADAVSLFAGGRGDVSATHIVSVEGNEPTLWHVGRIPDTAIVVTCVRLLGSTVTYVGSVHRDKVKKGVLTKQTLYRFNTGIALAPSVARYIPRPLYVQPLPDPLPDPFDAIRNRVKLLLELVELLKTRQSFEEQAIVAVEWHEKVFADVNHLEDDMSQAVLLLLVDQFQRGIADKLMMAEAWIRMIRVFLTAPSETQLLKAISWPMVRKPILRRKGASPGKPKFAPRNTRTGRLEKRRTIIPCRPAEGDITVMPFEMESLLAMEGAKWTRIAHIPELQFHTQLVVPFETVPDLIASGAFVPLGNLSVAIRPQDLWAVRIKRNTVVRRDHLTNIVLWVRSMQPTVRQHNMSAVISNLPVIDMVYQKAPPCIQSLINKMQRGKLHHNERRALYPSLLSFGYDSDVAIDFLQRTWGDKSDWRRGGVQKDLQDLTRDADRGKLYPASCKQMAAIKHCPFAKEVGDIEDMYRSMCYDHGQKTHGFDSPKPTIYKPGGYLKLALH